MRTAAITTHQDPQSPGGVYVLVTSGQMGAHPGNSHREAFAIDGGITIHTVEFDGDRPLWDEAGEVEPSRASNPGLCAYVAEVLADA